MKKHFVCFLLLLIALVFLPLSMYSQSSTPNIGLQIPATGSNNWYIPLNYNFTKLDQLLSGNLALTTLNLGTLNVNTINITGGSGFLTGTGANNFSLPYWSGTTPTKNLGYLSFSGLPFYSTTAIPRLALFGDITNLWASGSCVGYLKNDGTCDSGGTPTAAGITTLIKTQTDCNIDGLHYWNPFTGTCTIPASSGSMIWPPTPGITVCSGTPCTSWLSSLAAPTGTVVGTTDAQILTHKNLTDASNTFPILNQNSTGSAAKLTTSRAINGVNFDGTAAITITAVPSGTCGGAMTGTFPNCTIAGLGGAGYIPQTDGSGNLLASVAYFDTNGFLNIPSPGINIDGSFPPTGGSVGVYLNNSYCGNTYPYFLAATNDTENAVLMAHVSPCNSTGEFGPADTTFIGTTGSAHPLVGGVTATITNILLTSNVVTLTASNSFTTSPTTYVILNGLTVGTFLNGNVYTVQSASSTQFTVNFTHANVSSTTETGFAIPYTDNVLNAGNQGTGIVNLGPQQNPLISIRTGLAPNGIYLPFLTNETCLGTDNGGKLGAGTCSGGTVSDGAGTTTAGQAAISTTTAHTIGYSAAPAFSAANLTSFPTLNQNTTGNAITATNLATYPTLCTSGQFSQGLSSGSNNCGTPAGGAVTSVFGRAGVVAATSGDYTVGQVTSAASTIAPNTFTQTAAGLGNIFTQFTGATTTCANNVITFAVNGVNDGCLYRNTGSLFFRFGVAPTTGVVNGWGFDEQLAVVGAITASGTITSNLGTAAITSATGGTGVTSVTCATASCNVSRGSYTVVGGTATTGTIITLVWPTTTTAWVCSVDENGGTAFLGLGHSIATATGMTITSAISVASTTFNVDYNCVP